MPDLDSPRPNGHLKRYAVFIRDCERSPCPRQVFDDEWAPMGEHLRGELVRCGFAITTEEGGLALTSAGREMADEQ